MKKFSIVALCGALATVGGVFAAWTFGEFTIEQPESLEITSKLEVEETISAVFKITGSVTNNNVTYKVNQNEDHDGLVLERTLPAEADAGLDDLTVTIKIEDADEFAIFDEYDVNVTAKVTFAASGEGDSLLDIVGAEGEKAVDSDFTFPVKTAKVGKVDDVKVLSDEVGFTLKGSGAINEDFPILCSAEADAYIKAFKNTTITYSFNIALAE